ncbi:MAG: Yip1 family protein [bacterium]
MTLTERVKNILVQPRQEWEVIARERSTVAEAYKSYVIPLAAIGPVASVIGLSVIGFGVPTVGRYRVPIGASIVQAIVTFALSLAAVYVLALIIDALAPTFSGQKNQVQAFKLAAYSSTAAWLAGIFGLIPALGFLAILGLYSLYLLYVGVPVLMKVPESKVMGYTVAVIIAAIVLFVLVAVVGGMMLPAPTFR